MEEFGMRKSKFAVIVIGAAAMFAAGCGQMGTNSNSTAMNTSNRGTMMSNNANTMTSGTPMANTSMANNMGPGATTTVAAIMENPDPWIGKSVTVVADVEEVWGPRVFSLDEDSVTTGGIDNDIAVLSPKAGALANVDDQWLNNKVRVSGVVHRFVVAEVERELGWDLDPKIETEIEARRPVIIATGLERLPR